VLLAAVATSALVPGLYGEYYLHVAHGHAHDHADAGNSAHLLTGGGVLFAVAASHVALLAWFGRDR
jgi:hypothetical protein